MCSGEKSDSPFQPLENMPPVFCLEGLCSFLLDVSLLLLTSAMSASSSSSMILSATPFFCRSLKGDLFDLLLFLFSVMLLSTCGFSSINPTSITPPPMRADPLKAFPWLCVWLGSKNPLLGILVMRDTSSSCDPYTTFVFCMGPRIVVGSSTK